MDITVTMTGSVHLLRRTERCQRLSLKEADTEEGLFHPLLQAYLEEEAGEREVLTHFLRVSNLMVATLVEETQIPLSIDQYPEAILMY